MNFEKYLSSRRSIYKLGKNTKLSVEEIENLVSIATKYVPSPFNDQSQRVVLLLNDNHETFWDIVYQELKKIAPPENLAKTEEKLKNFANGIGTILFFDDKTVTENNFHYTKKTSVCGLSTPMPCCNISCGLN